MKKLILIILLLIPVSIIAQPQDLSREIAEYTGGYYIGELENNVHFVQGANYHDYHSLMASITDMVKSYSDLNYVVYWTEDEDNRDMLYSGIVWGDRPDNPDNESYLLMISKTSNKVAIILAED